MAGETQSFTRRSWHRAAAAALVLAFVAQVHWSVRGKSAILHEPLYVYAGYQYLTRQAYHINFDSPPLLKQLAALPLLPLDLDPVGGEEEHVNRLKRRFFFENRVPAERMLRRARLPFLALGALLGFIVFRWTTRLYGSRAGLLALALYAFNPALLGQCGFANHDFGVTCLSVATLYAFWRLRRRPTARRVIYAGGTLGLALVTKFSALLLVPVIAALSIVETLMSPGPVDRPRALARWSALLTATLALAGLVVWADYGFTVGSIPFDEFHRVLSGAAPEAPLTRLLGRLPAHPSVPAAEYLEGALAQSIHGGIGHINYLLGEVSSRGWWYYYLVTLLYRAPIALMVLTLARAALRKRPEDEKSPGASAWDGAWVLVYPVVTLVLFSLSRTQLGERYILVVYPLLFVFLGGLVNAAAFRRPGFRIGLAACLLWYVGSSVRIHPNYLMYFNELAGGPDGGYHKLVEGIDLGQDLGGVKRFAEDRNIPEIKVSCFGCQQLRYLGPVLQRLGCKPTTGWIAVSVRQRVMPQPFLPSKCFDWLSDQEPVARIGRSIHVFHVGPGGD